jgi:redox-sensitive bicupin YhaK (pirin superfamily)
MIRVRKAEERGRAQFDWLDSRHTFSFGHYYDPEHMGFGHLRVINDDRVIPGGGFDTHGHRDMEIVSVILEGAMEHKDNLGHGSVIRAGDVQRMTAGTGITHSEFNHSPDNPLRFLQIWVVPERMGMTPGYEQKHYPVECRQGLLKLVGSPDGREDSVTIHQDVFMYSTRLDGQTAGHKLAAGRRAWLQVLDGRMSVNGMALVEGDGAAISEADGFDLEATDAASALVFDLA